MRIDLTDLELFLHVAESGSITAGAQRSHLALASASVRIKGMEDSLGAPLLTRGRRGAELTAAGRIVLHHAREVLGQLERMGGALNSAARGLRSAIRLWSTAYALTDLLSQALRAFLADSPMVDIDLEERFSPEIVQALGQGKADVGIVSALADLTGLETFPFRNDRLVVIAACGHPLAGQRDMAFAEALDYAFIGLSEGSAFQAFLAGQAAYAGKQLLYRARVKSVETVCSMVGHDMGIGVVPESSALRCHKTNNIRMISINDSWAAQHLVLCVRRFDILPGYAKQLVERLRMETAERAIEPVNSE